VFAFACLALSRLVFARLEVTLLALCCLGLRARFGFVGSAGGFGFAAAEPLKRLRKSETGERLNVNNIMVCSSITPGCFDCKSSRHLEITFSLFLTTRTFSNQLFR